MLEKSKKIQMIQGEITARICTMLAELTFYKLNPILGPGPFRESRHLLPKLHSGPIISSKVRKFQRFQDETSLSLGFAARSDGIPNVRRSCILLSWINVCVPIIFLFTYRRSQPLTLFLSFQFLCILREISS